MQLRSTIIFALVAIALSAPAHAQSITTGAIQGRVIDVASNEPLPGVTVWAESPALLEPQTAITDEDGQYKITELPPGEYTVTFHDLEKTVRAGIEVSANHVTPVFQAIKRGEAIRIFARAPQIKLGSTDISSKLDRKFLEAVPLPSRTADGAAGTQAGAHNDGAGVAYSGSTSLENRYLVDGIDITGLTYGDVGTAVLNQFVEEIEVLAGGYNAEWGRATGGIVNIVTKSGSNKLGGSVFGTFAPGLLSASRRRTPINASSIDVTSDRALVADFGFDLGGPIKKDRLWFYVGFAPQISRVDYTRITKRRTDCRALLPSGELSGCDARLQAQGGLADGQPDIDPRTGFFLTDEIDREIREGTSASYSAIGKLNLALSPKSQGQLSVIAAPSRDRSPGLFGLPTTGRRAEGMTIDAAARWSAKLDNDRLELEALVALHRSTLDTGALDATLDALPAQTLFGFGDLGTWSAMGGESQATQAGCTDGGSGDPYRIITNCPMQTRSYAIGGPGPIARDTEDRRQIRVSVLRRARLAGTHELKAGLDAENDTKVSARLLSGGASLLNAGNQVNVERWVQLAPIDATDGRYDQMCNTPDPDAASTSGTKSFRCDFLSGKMGTPGTAIEGQTIHWAAFLRDSWQPLSNLVLNAGVRYEEQRLRYARDLRGTTDTLTGNEIGTNAMNLRGNFAPRLGITYDPTEVGRSKLFASWGRFFEAIPMDINDRSFGGEVRFQQVFSTTGPGRPCGPTDPKLGAPDGMGCLDPATGPSSEQLIGSSGVLVAPGIKAQYLDEALLGVEYQLAEDLKLGIVYQNRSLGRVIEDVSTDGANTYMIANPGEWSVDDERALKDRIARTDDPALRMRLENQLVMFRGIRLFDRPQRTHDALQLTLAHRFSKGFYVQASYTYSRTAGNFPGLISYDNGQIDPNISSQYDLIELLANRTGRLPQDRPHSIKVDGYYSFDLGKHNALTIGGRLRAVSGIPVNALGGHYLYGPDESFLLPRGQLGRTGMQHGADLHVGYARKLPRGMKIEAFVDVFNAYNHQGTFDVDKTYAPRFKVDGTEQNANPISGGTFHDLIFAKAIDGAGTETANPIARNPNFGKPVTRYAPASAQVGVRLTF